MTEPSPELDEGIPVPPPAAAMMEALRGLGYSLPEAVADIIDNSISAAARNIWITFHWAGRHSFIAIVDDGAGMSERDLSWRSRSAAAIPVPYGRTAIWADSVLV